jgi:hypothetical protein
LFEGKLGGRKEGGNSSSREQPVWLMMERKGKENAEVEVTSVEPSMPRAGKTL